MAQRVHISVQAEDDDSDFGSAETVDTFCDALVTKRGQLVHKVIKLYCRTGPVQMFARASARHGELLVFSNVWVHVVIERNGVVVQQYRPAMQVNVSGWDDWLGRVRVDLYFWLCGQRVWLHRVAAYRWGNRLGLTWAQFTYPRYHADHTSGDCYVVWHSECEIVTERENDARQARRAHLRDQYEKRRHLQNLFDLLPKRDREPTRTLQDLLDRYPLPSRTQ